MIRSSYAQKRNAPREALYSRAFFTENQGRGSLDFCLKELVEPSVMLPRALIFVQNRDKTEGKLS